MERLELGFDRVLHSPLLRAVETARLLEPLTRGDGRVETELLAREPEERLLALLSGLRVAVVGHEPYLGALVSWLVMGKMEEGERFPFKKGGLYWLEGMVAPGGMKLKAALPPKVLRGIGGFGS
jgi:phosphohistidine phosphatase